MKKFSNYPSPKKLKKNKNKNLLRVFNKPLIYWTINFAKKLSKKSYDLVVTSDCDKIAKICDKEKVFFSKKTKKNIK